MPNDRETSSVTTRLALDHVRTRLGEDGEQALLSAADVPYRREQLEPEIFGLPPARVVHGQCQSDGADACVDDVTWAARSRWRRTGPSEDPELALLREQLDSLHSVATDLVSSDRVEEVLQRITERAASAVLAPAYLLAVEPPEGGDPMVFSAGLDTDRAAELARLLLAGGDLGCPAVVVDVASTRRHHGRLAALLGDGQLGLADEQRMLGLYARHAALALDMLVAVGDSRRGEQRATALLSLSHRLAGARGVTDVAEVVTTVLPQIVGCPQTAVLLWDSGEGVLRTAACAGLSPPRTALMMAARLRPDEVPELVDMLSRRHPMLIDRDTTGPVLGALLSSLGTRQSLVAPLLAGDNLLGVATAGWDEGLVDDVRERTDRLAGVADQTATALLNARLVDTIEHQSLHDELTSLPNRSLFGARLEEALRSCRPGEAVAVLFCDLDRFKRVNDALGHAAGDELLRQVAARLLGCLRPGDTVGRLSGDEFAVLLPRVGDLDGAQLVAERIVRCFDTAFRVEGRELRVTTSVGVAGHDGPEGRGDRLLRAADTALYEAKQRGRNQIARADAPTGVRLAGPSLEQELGGAVGAGQLRLHFQPLVALHADGDQVAGAEALLRWQHPRLGLLAPAAFLPVAEDCGQVVELDLWAVRTACEQAARWALDPVLPPRLQLSVNVSTRTLTDARLVPAVRAALTDHGLPPELLCLEVVESASLGDLHAVVARLQELRQMGVRTALDDFGTGFSTLSWLQRLPVDRIKLDRTFVTELPAAAAVTLVRGVVALAGELGIEVVAEGVETAEQLAALRAAGCLSVQGYLLGRPSPELLTPTPAGVAVA